MNEFQKAQHAKTIELQKKKCTTCTGILAMPKSKIKSFYDAMLDPTINAPTIADVLSSWGIATSVTTIQNHRRGEHNYASHMVTIKKAAGLD
jgi:hypothetical protein